MPVIEQVRYSSARRHGYHGGLTLPEVAVPLAVYWSELDGFDGWEPTTFAPPSWWHPSPVDDTHQTPPAPTTVDATSRKPKRPKARPADQAQLFDPGDASDLSDKDATDHLSASEESPPGPVVSGSIGRIVVEAVIVERLAKHRLDPGQATITLSQLDRYGTTAVGLNRLADQIGYPRMRMGRLLAQLQRVVNIDGAGVIELAGDEVRFDRLLLERQLGL